ncbi:MAG: putative PEP-binding protein [Faecalibacterium prausnitzii]
MMLPGRILDEQEQYFFYCSCLAAANGCPVTVRTFDFGSDRTVADANQGRSPPSSACAASATACASPSSSRPRSALCCAPPPGGRCG